MRKRREVLSKSHSRIQQAVVGPTWRMMFAFRTKRGRGFDGSSSVIRVKSKSTVGNLFFALPTELQICVLRELLYADILSLRLVSRSFHQLIGTNESQIVRHHIDYHVPRHILELYPPPSELNLKFLSGLAQRQFLSCNIAQHLAAYISKQIRGRSLAGRDRYRSQHQRMRRRLVPIILTLFQFFERYQHRLLAETYTGNKISYRNADQPVPIQQEIMESYNPALLLRVSQTYRLLLYLLRQRLAPPSRAFSLARTRSGRSLARPAEDSMVKLLIIGGLSQVQKIWSIKNRSRRRKALEKWIAELQPRENDGLEGNLAEPQPDWCSTVDREKSRDSGKVLQHEHTSPSSRLPMLRPSASAIARLIPVLPPLRAVWIPSARELILAKGLDATDAGVWELFIDELVSGDDSEDEYEYLEEEDSGDEDPDDSGDESEEMCLDGHTLMEET